MSRLTDPNFVICCRTEVVDPGANRKMRTAGIAEEAALLG